MNALDQLMRNAASKSSSSSIVSRKRKSSSSSSRGKDDKIQLCLNLGQKGLHSIECSVCGMRYARGLVEDEQSHTKYHKKYVEGVVWNSSSKGGEQGIVVVDLDKTQFKARWSALEQVMELVYRDLGGMHVEDWSELDADRIVLVVEHRKVKGCVVLENIVREKHRVASVMYRVQADRVDAEIVGNCGAIVGIQKLWVHQAYRKQRMSRVLLDYCVNVVLEGKEKPEKYLAFTELTLPGLACVRSYFKLGELDAINYYSEKGFE
jgi:GNAT superfamily N-acetyltransferase